MSPAGPTRSRRGRMTGLALAAGIAVALFAATRVYKKLFDHPARPAGAATVRAAEAGVAAGVGGAGPAPEDEAGTFTVQTAEGEVRVFRGGQWIAVRQGDRLTRDDFVRTSARARAVLRLSAGSEVELRERVEIRLDRLSSAGSSVDLRRGKLVARVSAAQGTDALSITARDTRTASDGPSHFVVQADERGQVSVAALKGAARFASGGKTVTVKEGTETRSQPGQPPDDPERIPEEVLLQVVWPEGEKRAETTPVRGHVAPTSTVTVNGAPAAVGPDGEFTADVPLRDGANEVEVTAEDLSGRTRRATTTLQRRTVRPPKLAAEPSNLWKRPDGGT